MPAVCLNGKFAAQQITGVQRAARAFIEALDRHEGPAVADWLLLRPAGTRPLPLRYINQREIGWPGMPLHLWEQWALPQAARGALLVNLAGSAPWWPRGRQLTLIHDAAVFDRPEAYTPCFAAWYRHLHRRLARNGSALLTVSAFSQARLAAALALAPDRIGLLPNGGDHLDDVPADAAVLPHLGLSEGRYLLAVASANPNKNIDGLIAAFTRLPAARGLQLVLCGGDNPQVFARAPAACATAGVLRIGYQDDRSLKALYQHALALVFPSVYEGFGLPPLEAMACGCPVIAARAAAIPEVCGDAALYVEPQAIDALTAALQRVHDDAGLRDSLRRAGAARVASFRWRHSAALLRRHVGDVSFA
ncbi:glycosyltransferase family 4 protein [Aquabacterium sp.]|uniref:glycosyltransferase family 4 protein n=1 Tax=Aquabacterium sp. TaxID=1872578 RepID=UPI002CA14121|nr:glycosyltransferase family 1 protein [Aquabacterium sp.]HSW07411.1 glycosyltransferase family 1 protein [Aquabacterium sp.]